MPLLVLLVLSGCWGASENQEKQPCVKAQESSFHKNNTMSDDEKRERYVQALNAALKAVAKNGPIGNREFRVIVGEYSALNDNVAKATSGWLVCVTFLPEKPGGEVLVLVNKSGTATITPGL